MCSPSCRETVVLQREDVEHIEPRAKQIRGEAVRDSLPPAIPPLSVPNYNKIADFRQRISLRRKAASLDRGGVRCYSHRLCNSTYIFQVYFKLGVFVCLRALARTSTARAR